ncbi:hypothetical protein NPIL_687161, partial [Nephila pilipes]
MYVVFGQRTLYQMRRRDSWDIHEVQILGQNGMYKSDSNAHHV